MVQSESSISESLETIGKDGMLYLIIEVLDPRVLSQRQGISELCIFQFHVASFVWGKFYDLGIEHVSL